MMTERQIIKTQIEKAAAEFRIVQLALTERKKVVKAMGGNASKGSTTDPTLRELFQRDQELNNKLRELHNQRKALPKPAPGEDGNPPRIPRGHYPTGEPVNLGNGLFEGCTGYEKRLIALLAREVGKTRYEDLRRIASDVVRSPEKVRYVERPVDYDKLMRNNYNTYAGSEL